MKKKCYCNDKHESECYRKYSAISVTQFYLFTIMRGMKPRRSIEVNLHTFFTLALGYSKWSASISACISLTLWNIVLEKLNLITLRIFGEEYRLWSSSLCNFLHDPSTSLLGPNIPNILFSKTLSLCSSLKVRDQVPHPYSTTSKITVFRIYQVQISAKEPHYHQPYTR